MDRAEAFKRIFEMEDFGTFVKDPSRLLAFMMDTGMDDNDVRTLRFLISSSRRDFVEAISTDDERIASNLVGSISQNTGIMYERAADIIGDVRIAAGLSPLKRKSEEEKPKSRSQYDRYSIGDKVLKSDDILFTESSIYRGCLCVCGYVGRYSIMDVPSSVNFEGHVMEVTDIAKGALTENQYVKTVKLPENVVAIGDEAFMWAKVETVSMPGVREMGTNAFMSCPLTTLTLPKVKIVEYNSFTGCEYLKTVEFPEGITMIREGAFMGCGRLESIVLPSTLTVLEGSAFADCTSLRSVVLPDSLLVVGYDSFRNCSRLSSVTFGKNTVEIEACAFEGCDYLRSVTLPRSVTKIEAGAFPKGTKIIREGESGSKPGFFKLFSRKRYAIRNLVNRYRE